MRNHLGTPAVHLSDSKIKDLDAAWDIYFAVIKRVEEPLHQLTTLDSQYGYN